MDTTRASVSQATRKPAPATPDIGNRTGREALSDSRTIEITETGVFKGEIEINVAEISGQFEGSLAARNRLIIHSKGSVKGRSRYAEIEVERGGRIEGDVQVISEAEVTEISPGPSGDA